ncbi:MAG: LPS export ABC transporter periplasmic protein LptC [Chloroflexi bacterium]|nr:LPS export ABC transporter periplasmic protein LptC [Chloroflexota bacterium]
MKSGDFSHSCARHFLVCLLIILAAVICQCSRNKAPEPHASPSIVPADFGVPEGTPGSATFESTWLASKHGSHKYWEINAGQIEINEETKTGRVLDIKCNFYGKSDEPILKVEAPLAELDMATESVVFKGKVKVLSTQGEGTLDVGALRWDGKKKIIVGSSGVRIDRNGTLVTADEIYTNPELTDFKLKGNVRMRAKDMENPLGAKKNKR